MRALVVSTLLLAVRVSGQEPPPVVHVGDFGLKVMNVRTVPSLQVAALPEKVVSRPDTRLVVVTLQGRFSAPGRYTVASNLFSVQFEEEVPTSGMPPEVARLAMSSKETKIVSALFVADEEEHWGVSYGIEAPGRYTSLRTVTFVVALPNTVDSFTVLAARPVGEAVHLGRP